MTEDNNPGIARELVELAWRNRREGKLDDARRDMVRAIALLRQADGHVDLVTALGRLGHIEMDLYRWGEASKVYEEAIRICRDAGDSLGLAHKTRHLGDVHRHAGREEEARECYQKALSLYQNHMDPPKLDYANAIRMVAILKEELGQVDQATELWMQARELYDAVNVPPGVDECTKRIEGLQR